MKQTLVGVSKQLWSVIPFLGVNRQDIDIRAKKATKAEKNQYYGEVTASISYADQLQPAESCRKPYKTHGGRVLG